jgi:diguanylate cyclase (GGDEF)-like protein/PAS domain S-box-containing protein
VFNQSVFHKIVVVQMEQHEYYRQILDHLAEGVYFVDCDRKIRYWNRTAQEISGYESDEVVGRYCQDEILDHRDEQNRPLCKDACPLSECMQSGKSLEQRVFLRRKDGVRLPVDIRVAPVRDSSGSIVGAVEMFHDVSGAVEVEHLNEELKKLVRVDSLTGIPNRLALDEALEREYQRFLRYGTTFSLIFSDIDHFKTINDRFGHQVGDRSLRWVSSNLQRTLRRSDLVGRYGGEEFMILLVATRLEVAAKIAEQLRAHLENDQFDELGETVTASFGVAEMCRDESPATLIEKADRAMYRAKELGRNRVVTAEECGLNAEEEPSWQRSASR